MPVDLSAVTPDADMLRALARSSPWRWTSLHLVREVSTGHQAGRVEAWVRRPGWMRTIDDRGERTVEEPPASCVRTQFSADGAPATHRRVVLPLPGAVRPTYRPDGLVARRPEAGYDDPLYDSYQWVAMLDPVELSEGVAVLDVRRVVRAGRVTWAATVRAGAGYEARCGGGCCELLPNASSWYAERDDEPPGPFPDHHEVALDLQTGVVVSLAAVGGPPGGFETTILDVDQPVGS